ncbi:unnamed protein product [Prunus armeniaca]
MSPKYAMGGMFSEKFDGYSFGVLQLEIISGKKNTSFYSSDQHIGFLAYVHIDGDDDGDVSGDGVGVRWWWWWGGSGGNVGWGDGGADSGGGSGGGGKG